MIKYGNRTSTALALLSPFINGAGVDGYPNANEDYLDQMWLIEAVGTENAKLYTIRNVQLGAYMELSDGRDGTSVVGKTNPVGNDSRKWYIDHNHKDKTRWKIQNKAHGTFVDLKNQGRDVVGWRGTWDDVTSERHQDWVFECFSINRFEIRSLLKQIHFVNENDFEASEHLYFLLPRHKIWEIFRNANIGHRQWRHELYDSDDFALVAKSKFAEWGNNNIKKSMDEVKGVAGQRQKLFAIQCGVVFARSMVKGIEHEYAYNWFIERGTNKLLLFNPRNDGEFLDTHYSLTGYFAWT